MKNRLLVSLFLLCSSAAALAQTSRVQRPTAPTPEVRSAVPQEIAPGQTATVIIKGRYFTSDARAEGNEVCAVRGVKFVSDSELQLTLAAANRDEGGDCSVRIQMGGRTVWTSFRVPMTAAGRAREQQRQQQESQRAQQQMADRVAHARAILGKRWDVKLPNGSSDTWTLVSTNQFGFSQFKNARGQQLMIIVGEKDNIVVQMEGCVLNGQLVNGKLTNGQSFLPSCPVGKGAWTATVSQ